MAQKRTTFTHAVVMGDLVGSETAPSIPRLHAAFNAAIQSANRTHRKQIASPLTITLGDEFQGLAVSLAAGLSIIRQLRHGLLAEGVPCRFVLGLARLETPVNAAKSWNMMGPGLSNAREKLSDKTHPSAYRFSLPTDGVTETLLDALGMSITDIENDWTDRQFEIVSQAMSSDQKNALIAQKLGIGERTYYKVLRAARYDLYETCHTALAVAATDLDQRHNLT